jgi:hypothetical protein
MISILKTAGIFSQFVSSVSLSQAFQPSTKSIFCESRLIGLWDFECNQLRANATEHSNLFNFSNILFGLSKCQRVVFGLENRIESHQKSDENRCDNVMAVWSIFFRLLFLDLQAFSIDFIGSRIGF